MTSADFDYMKEALAADLAELIAKEFGMTVTEALDAMYGSDTYSKLCDPNTGLYFQSSRYVYSFLRNELLTAKMG